MDVGQRTMAHNSSVGSSPSSRYCRVPIRYVFLNCTQTQYLLLIAPSDAASQRHQIQQCIAHEALLPSTRPHTSGYSLPFRRAVGRMFPPKPRRTRIDEVGQTSGATRECYELRSTQGQDLPGPRQCRTRVDPYRCKEMHSIEPAYSRLRFRPNGDLPVLPTVTARAQCHA